MLAVGYAMSFPFPYRPIPLKLPHSVPSLTLVHAIVAKGVLNGAEFDLLSSSQRNQFLLAGEAARGVSLVPPGK